MTLTLQLVVIHARSCCVTHRRGSFNRSRPENRNPDMIGGRQAEPLNLICHSISINFLALWATISFQGTPAPVPQKSAAARSSQTGLVFDPIYLRHLAGNADHPERPERLTAIMNGFEKAGLLKSLYRIAPRRATEEELALVHSFSYLALVQREVSNLQGLHEPRAGAT